VISLHQFNNFNNINNMMNNNLLWNFNALKGKIVPHLSVSPDTVNLGAGITSASVFLTSNSQWEVYNSPSWLKVTPLSGTGNTALLLLMPRYSASPQLGEVSIRLVNNPTITATIYVSRNPEDPFIER
jgi:hypothetical protein